MRAVAQREAQHVQIEKTRTQRPAQGQSSLMEPPTISTSSGAYPASSAAPRPCLPSTPTLRDSSTTRRYRYRCARGRGGTSGGHKWGARVGGTGSAGCNHQAGAVQLRTAGAQGRPLLRRRRPEAARGPLGVVLAGWAEQARRDWAPSSLLFRLGGPCPCPPAQLPERLDPSSAPRPSCMPR